MGELHLEILVDRMRREFNVEANVGKPQVAYRETIRKAVERYDYTHKKQTGGSGQFAKVQIAIEPLEMSADGATYEFENKVTGGRIRASTSPRSTRHAGRLQYGVLAGYPMVGVKASLLDGQYHEVDSSEMAFKIAGSIAFKEAARKASPALLEPLMAVEVVTPEENMGDVIGDLNSRRGTIQAMDERSGARVVKARCRSRDVRLRGRSAQPHPGTGELHQLFDSAEVPRTWPRRSSPRSRASSPASPEHVRTPRHAHDCERHGERNPVAKAKFERTKPHVNIGTIGHIDHGKTTLTAAIPRSCTTSTRTSTRRPRSTRSTRRPRRRLRHHDLDRARRVPDREASLRARRLPRARRLHQEHDHRWRRWTARSSWSRRPTAPCRRPRSILLARQVGVPYIVVALNKADMVDDEEILELVELEVRELLEYEFPGDDLPVVRVSALKALEGDKEWGDKLMELMDAVDTAIPEPEREIDKPFLMPSRTSSRSPVAVPSSPVASSVASSRSPRRSRSSVSARTRPRRPSPASRCSASCSTRARPVTTSVCSSAASSARTWSAARSS